MGICIEAWRGRIGAFCQPAKTKSDLKSLKPKHVMLSIRIALFLMLIAQCVESNPGPATKGRTGKQGKQVSEPTQLPGTSREMTLLQHNRESRAATRVRRSEVTHISQNPSVSSWLLNQHSDASSHDPASTIGTTKDVFSDPGDDQPDSEQMDTKALLLDIRKDVKSMNRRFDQFEESVNEIRSENNKLKAQNEILVADVSSLTSRLDKVEDCLMKSTRKQESLETQVKKSNLKFHGIPQASNETPETIENAICGVITDSLDIERADYTIEKAYRINSRSKPSPVIVQYSIRKQRDTILYRFRSKRKNTELPFRISEDLPERVSKARACMYPFLVECTSQGKKAFFRNEYLFVGSDKYVFD